jgi:serine/threonine protein kinase
MSESVPPRRGGFSTAVDLETEEGRAFLQERLAFLGKVGFILSFGGFCMVTLVQTVLGSQADLRAWPLRPKSPLTLGMALVFLGGWLLCRRGGAPDVAKVVDFGLVRELDGASDPSLSGLGTIAGTPLYLSPEAITRPERRNGGPATGSG